MKIKDGFVKRTVVGTVVAIPVGEKMAQFRGMINLQNETTEFIWDMLSQSEWSFEQLLNSILQEFDVNQETAEADLRELLSQLRKACVIEE